MPFKWWTSPANDTNVCWVDVTCLEDFNHPGWTYFCCYLRIMWKCGSNVLNGILRFSHAPAFFKYPENSTYIGYIFQRGDGIFRASVLQMMQADDKFTPTTIIACECVCVCVCACLTREQSPVRWRKLVQSSLKWKWQTDDCTLTSSPSSNCMS